MQGASIVRDLLRRFRALPLAAQMRMAQAHAESGSDLTAVKALLAQAEAEAQGRAPRRSAMGLTRSSQSQRTSLVAALAGLRNAPAAVAPEGGADGAEVAGDGEPRKLRQSAPPPRTTSSGLDQPLGWSMAMQALEAQKWARIKVASLMSGPSWRQRPGAHGLHHSRTISNDMGYVTPNTPSLPSSPLHGNSLLQHSRTISGGEFAVATELGADNTGPDAPRRRQLQPSVSFADPQAAPGEGVKRQLLPSSSFGDPQAGDGLRRGRGPSGSLAETNAPQQQPLQGSPPPWRPQPPPEALMLLSELQMPPVVKKSLTRSGFAKVLPAPVAEHQTMEEP